MLASEELDLWLALELYNTPASGLRMILEARLLAGESCADIAKNIGVETGAIAQYELCFFDIRDRLTRTDFICAEVLAGNVAGSNGELDHPLMFRRIGYHFGSVALDYVLHGGAQRGAMVEAPAKMLEAHIQGLLLPKTLLAIDRIDPADQKAAGTILQMYARLRALHDRDRDTSPLQTELIKTAEALFKNIEFTIGPEGVPEKLREWSETAVELRPDEMQQVAAGKRLAKEAELKSMKLRG
jgi:hypothetical protein